jgi:hypothetical protein
MDRTSALNNIDIGGGKRGYRDRNLGAGLAGTQLIAADRNAVQEEILAVIEGLGIVASAAVLTQLLLALKRAGAANAHSITASRALVVDDAGIVLVNATTGNITLTLPLAAAMNGVPIRYQIVRLDSTANTVSVALAGSDVRISANGVTGAWSVPARGQLTLMCDAVASWVEFGVQRLVNSQLFTTSGSFTVPAGIYQIAPEVWGGGSGGVGGDGAAGAAGGYSWGVFSVTPGAVYAVTIGAGGVGRTGASGLASGAGGTTSVGALISATGGSSVAGSPSSGPSGGGIGVGGQLNIQGQPGGDLLSSSVIVATGGSSPRGGMGGSGASAPTEPGGGGGAFSSDSGATGAKGWALITW